MNTPEIEITTEGHTVDEVYIENDGYTLVPVPEHEQSFLVRIDKGEYTETFLRISQFYIEEKTQQLSFDFNVVKTENESMDPSTEVNLHRVASLIVQDILKNSLEDGSIILYDAETGDKIER